MQKSNIIIPIRGTLARWPRVEEGPNKGDPNFRTMTDLKVLFSEEQIVVMCNRYLRQQEYQSAASEAYFERKRQAKKKPPQEK